MEKITLFVVCVFAAVFEGYKADSQIEVPSLENVPSLNDVSSLKNAANLKDMSSLEDTSEEELSIADRVELQIINLCTEVPLFYEDLINSFSQEGPLSGENLQKMQNIEAKLKSKTDDLKQYTSTYDQSMSAHDPDAENIEKLMFSAVDELVQSVTKINNDLNSELGQNAENAAGVAEDRAKIIQNYVKPAMVKFEESCLLQTKDILKNVLSDYEASLLS